MKLTYQERQYVLKHLGGAISKGVNPNAPDWDSTAIKTREEYEMLIAIFNKLSEEEKDERGEL